MHENKTFGYSHTDGFIPQEIDGFDSLVELALDMRWSWSHYADESGNSLILRYGLYTEPMGSSSDCFSRQAYTNVADPEFRKEVDTLVHKKNQAAESPSWFQQNHPQAPYLVLHILVWEFMLSEALPIYSGGLGNVAGDQLKAASDIGVPGGWCCIALSAGIFSAGY